MNIKSAQYIAQTITPFGGKEEKVNVSIKVIEELSDGSNLTHFVPITEDNRHYAEIVKRVNAGTLSIEDAV